MFILLSIVLFHLINNIIWLYFDRTYLLFDSWQHFLLSFKVFYFLNEGFFPWLPDILKGAGSFRWHGVLVGYLSAPFYFIFGLSQDSGVTINSSIFFTILVFSVYGIGKNLLSTKAGLLAAFLISMYPLVFNHSRVYLLDLPLTAMVCLAILILLKTENLASKKYSCLFAVVSGLALLIKLNFMLFILGPLTLVVYRIRKDNSFNLIKWNIVIIFFIVIIITFGFYGLKSREILKRIIDCSWLCAYFYSGEHFASIFQRWLGLGRDYFVFFLRDCFNNSVSPVFFLLFVFGAFSRNARKMILFIWLALPLLVLAFFFHYPDYNRYFMPVLPAIALISSAGVFGLKSARLKRLLVALIIVFGILQYFAISYRLDFIPEQVQIKIPLFGSKKSIPITLFKRTVSIGYRSDSDIFSYPAQTDPKNNGIFTELIMNAGEGPKASKKIFFIGNQNIARVYEPAMYRIFAERIPLLNMLIHVPDMMISEDLIFDPDKVRSADFVVRIRDKEGDDRLDQFQKNNLDKMNAIFDKNIGKFKLFKEFNFDGLRSISVYNRREKDYIAIANSDLEVFFRDGVMRIFYQDAEITGAAGLEFSFTRNRDFYNNSCFEWTSEVTAPDKMVISATEESLHLSMKCEIEIINDLEISLNAVFSGAPADEFKDICLSLFVSKEYTRWEAASRKESFISGDGPDFTQVRLPDLKSGPVIFSGPSEKRFPRVMFSSGGTSYTLPIVKWRKDLKAAGFYIDPNNGSPANRSIFSGTITLLPAETGIDN